MRGSGARNIRARVLTLLKCVPKGRVATLEGLAREAGTTERHIATILSSLGDDERTMVPWHRAVAGGGAIGRGPWREEQFARLVREGVVVSPAGVVHELARVTVIAFVQRAHGEEPPPAEETVPARWRGMRQH